MGIIITPDGTRQKLTPQKKFFTLYEISSILEGQVDISFVGEKWVFTNKIAYKINMPYNEVASAIFNYPIAGSCIIADHTELPPQFFVNKKKNQEYDMNDEDEDDDLMEPQQNEMKESSKNNDEKLKEEILKEANYLLFETGKTIDEILKNFIVYRKGDNTINYTNDVEKQIEILNDMMAYFLKIEEYEKCNNISNLIKHINI